MSKVIYTLLAIAPFLTMSCTTGEETARKPIGPTSDKTDMPWNRPQGPEGAGALGILNQ